MNGGITTTNLGELDTCVAALSGLTDLSTDLGCTAEDGATILAATMDQTSSAISQLGVVQLEWQVSNNINNNKIDSRRGLVRLYGSYTVRVVVCMAVVVVRLSQQLDIYS